MHTSVDRLATSIGGVLEAHGGERFSDRPHQWRRRLGEDDSFPIEAILVAEWLTMTSPLPPGLTACSRWQLLELNATLPAMVRVALDPRTGQGSVRVDVGVHGDDIENDEPFVDRVREGWQSLGVARRRLPRAASLDTMATSNKADPLAGSEPGPDLQALIVAAGWHCVQRAAGALSVELDVPHQSIHAFVTAESRSGVRAYVELGRHAVSSEASREAVALFLLCAATVTRLVRPIVDGHGRGPRPGLEVRWAIAPTGEEVSHALQALSVVCRCVATEVDALCEESTASEYLKMNGQSDQDAQAA